MLIALRDALENCSLPDQVDNRSVDLDTTQVLRVADALVQIFQALDLSHAADDLVSKVLVYSVLLLGEERNWIITRRAIIVIVAFSIESLRCIEAR